MQLSGGGRERERLLIANAMAEGEPPGGGPPGPRIHGPGIFARLRYETFDANGKPLDQWQVRALVPPLPTMEESHGPDTPLLGREGCPPECQAQIARGGVLLERSGDPGLASEWVLRMPVNQPFDLGSRSLATHDVLDKTPRQLAVSSSRREGRTVVEPANVRVTLVEACAGRVRLGTVTRLKFADNATVPIVTGFRNYQWVQLDGCGTPEPLPRPPEVPAPPRAIPAPAPEVHAIAMRRGARNRPAALIVDESWFVRNPDPVEFALATICRYDPAVDSWVRVVSASRGTTRITARSPGEPRTPERIVVPFPTDVALYWAQWIERIDGDRRLSSGSVHEALVPSGPMSCNDLDLGPAPPGQVAACVPFTDRAQARFVPVPREACAR